MERRGKKEIRENEKRRREEEKTSSVRRDFACRNPESVCSRRCHQQLLSLSRSPLAITEKEH